MPKSKKLDLSQLTSNCEEKPIYFESADIESSRNKNNEMAKLLKTLRFCLIGYVIIFLSWSTVPLVWWITHLFN